MGRCIETYDNDCQIMTAEKVGKMMKPFIDLSTRGPATTCMLTTMGEATLVTTTARKMALCGSLSRLAQRINFTYCPCSAITIYTWTMEGKTMCAVLTDATEAVKT